MPHLGWGTHSALNRYRGKASGLRMLLLGLRYALLEDVEANGSFVLVYDQRWGQAKGSFYAAEEQ
jgi:hypothetical protein